MKCPACHQELEIVDSRPYQTLYEHVVQPNGEPHIRSGFGCTNRRCPASIAKMRWLRSGEGPYHLDPTIPVSPKQWKDGFNTPPDSQVGRLQRGRF